MGGGARSCAEEWVGVSAPTASATLASEKAYVTASVHNKICRVIVRANGDWCGQVAVST
jgi:hypothetical protein